MNNIGHIRAVIDKYTCSFCKANDSAKVVLSGRTTPPWPGCENVHHGEEIKGCDCIGCRCKVVPDSDRLGYAMGAALCFFGLHDYEYNLTERGLRFFARVGIDATNDMRCKRLWCSKTKKI